MRIRGIDAEQASAEVTSIFQQAERALGRVPTPLTALAHCPEIFVTMAKLGAAVGDSTLVEPRLKKLVSIRAAQIAGCPF